MIRTRARTRLLFSDLHLMPFRMPTSAVPGSSRPALLAGSALVRGLVMAVICGFWPWQLPAQTSDSVAVLSAVHGYIRALESRDTAHIRRVALPTHTSIAVPEPQGPDGEPIVRTLEQVIAGLAQETRRFEGRVWNERVLVHGGTALYVAPYEARYDGVLTSCGIDQYIMVRVRGEWRVSQLLYTSRRRGC